MPLPGSPLLSFTMGKVDMVLVGAEGVVENGGIINKVGCGERARERERPGLVLVCAFQPGSADTCFGRWFPHRWEHTSCP